MVGAISQATGNIWTGWPFVLGLFVVATAILLFIDVDKAKEAVRQYELEHEQMEQDSATAKYLASQDVKVEEYKK